MTCSVQRMRKKPTRAEHGRAFQRNALSRAAFRTFDPRNSLHPFVKFWQSSASGRCFSSRNEGASCEDVAQPLVGRLGDADAGSDFDVSGAESVVPDPQAGMRRSQIGAVVAGAGDAECFGQASGATGEANQIPRSAHFDFSRPRHLFNAAQRLDCAEQHASSLSVALARHIQAVMIAIDEVNVGVAGRAEQDGSAGGVAGGGVGGGIVFPEVSFDFDDASSEKLLAALAHQHLAEEFASHRPRLASEESASERMKSFPIDFTWVSAHASEILNAEPGFRAAKLAWVPYSWRQ